jgi:hypothetical protein
LEKRRFTGQTTKVLFFTVGSLARRIMQALTFEQPKKKNESREVKDAGS